MTGILPVPSRRDACLTVRLWPVSGGTPAECVTGILPVAISTDKRDACPTVPLLTDTCPRVPPVRQATEKSNHPRYNARDASQQSQP